MSLRSVNIRYGRGGLPLCFSIERIPNMPTIFREKSSFMTANDVMSLLSISSTTLWRHIDNNAIPKPFYVGRTRYWRESDFDHYFETLTT